ncbi:MAG TPA: HK97 family phage prohead protease, partial [Sporichthyaceae bacterium]
MTTTVLDTGAIDTAQAGPSALEFKDLAPSWRPPRLEFKTAAVLEPALSGDHTAAGSTLPGAQGLLGDLPGADQSLREVTAVVAVTGVRDEVGDTIVPGAFAQTLRERPRPKVCLGHDWNRPIGKTREIKELLPGDPGLPPTTYDGKPWPKEAGALLATFIPDPTKDGIDAYNSAKFYGPQESTYSIGYKTMAFDPDPQAARFLKQVAVYEYGPVLIPAHPLATLQGVKSTDSEGIETKVSQVRDTAYWGEAYGTPITAHMHPHGPKARAERRSGRVPSREVGTMGPNSPTKQAVGGEKIKPAQRAAQIEGTGLFAEPASDKRVLPHPTRASGKDQQHIDSLANEIAAGNADPDTPEDAHADIDKAVRGLLNEAITPAEVRQRLASHPTIDATGEQRNYQSGEPGSYDSDIDR